MHRSYFGPNIFKGNKFKLKEVGHIFVPGWTMIIPSVFYPILFFLIAAATALPVILAFSGGDRETMGRYLFEVQLCSRHALDFEESSGWAQSHMDTMPRLLLCWAENATHYAIVQWRNLCDLCLQLSYFFPAYYIQFLIVGSFVFVGIFAQMFFVLRKDVRELI